MGRILLPPSPDIKMRPTFLSFDAGGRRSRQQLSFFGSIALALTYILYLWHSNPLPTPALSSTSPAWHDLSAIQLSASTQPSSIIAPRTFPNLRAPDVPTNFSEIWAFSAHLDTRPKILIDGAPEISLVAAGPSALEVQSYWRGDESPLWCYIASGRPTSSWWEKGRNGERFFKVQAAVHSIPDGHVEAKNLMPLLITCSLVAEQGLTAEWQGLDLFVSLGTEASPPSPSTFLPVTQLPILELASHQAGLGHAALCLQPLVGDLYATSFVDYIAYYRNLGFTKFYSYLLNPGPETLKVLRDLDPALGVEVVRWMLPNEWLEIKAEYAVDPSEWDLPGLPRLSEEQEGRYAPSGTDPGKAGVRVWAYAQNAAHHECSMRAKVDGARWVANIDYDEYLVLRPPSGKWPPPSSTLSNPAASHITNFARTVDDQDLLPVSIEFQSAFVCATCAPTSAPPLSLAEKEGVDLLHPTPDVPSILVSPVRHKEFFGLGFRCKTIIDPWWALIFSNRLSKDLRSLIYSRFVNRAWFSTTLHQAIVPFITHAGVRCSDWTLRSSRSSGSYNLTCALPYQRAWRDVPVYLPPYSLSSPSSSSSFSSSLSSMSMPMEVERGTGAMLHLRASPEISRIKTEWTASSLSESSLNIHVNVNVTEGIEKLESVRVRGEEAWRHHLPPESLPGEVVQDWVVSELYGESLRATREEGAGVEKTTTPTRREGGAGLSGLKGEMGRQWREEVRARVKGFWRRTLEV